MTYIDIHILQSVPPSNLNRDDTGSPKSAMFGGVRRARVSSQAWKRATRRAFASLVDPSDVGYRTTRVVEMVARRIAERAPDREGEAVGLATAVVQAIGLDPKTPKLSKKRQEELAARGEPADQTPRSEYLVFLSTDQVDRLAEFALASNGPMDKRLAKALVQSDHGIDVGLFGRMVADDATLNVDSAVQVAHALSTHGVDTEFDYYTAVDDKNPEGETGAGMIGTVEFNSATLYRYATINIDGLLRNLGSTKAARLAAEAFVRGFITSMPTGKQNTFGNRTLPEAVVMMVRDDQPVSLVGAFETPVPNAGTGFLAASAEQLVKHAEATALAYSNAPRSTSVLVGTASARTALEPLGEPVSIDALVSAAGAAVAEEKH